MVKKRTLLLLVSFALLLCVMTACFDSPFQVNPHGPDYLNHLTPTALPRLPIGTMVPMPHFPTAGLGSTLPDLVAQYGLPSANSSAPLYDFADHGQEAWPRGSVIVVTMKNDRAVEFSYDPGSDHPMTFQEAQDFVERILPDDATTPTSIQQEDDHQGKCLVKIYQSKILMTLFAPSAFMTPDGKDSRPGTITVNFFPDLDYQDYPVGSSVAGQNSETENAFKSHNQVGSLLVNLGSVPSC